MMKYLLVYALLLLLSCPLCQGQIKTDLSKATGKTGTNVAATANRANFSGVWKLNELKSEQIGNFPICIFGEQDHVRSNTMKIAEQVGFLTLDVTSPSIDGELVPRQEKLIFDDKEREAIRVGYPREKSTAKWSDDGQTMTVISARTFDPYGEQAAVEVTEAWKLINDGQSIAVQVNVSSTSGENTRRLVFDKQ